ncbi:C-jun-amino-terminal kinase-interacting protein 3 [Plakobranchus ocellatus]|uniref:C-jun-amino-terminal kinase-interacting protein 3 n=1 Tax=Plakobranchus ocellatus TaxID=259542 RepID=A0AAV3ZEL7_9GAST|nr:C-jun-amino-terminal kinase-interacting protein 3 [Plakobranchus ocellatus]
MIQHLLASSSCPLHPNKPRMNLTLLRVWDCFLLEGPKVLFRFSLAILHTHSKEIIMKSDTISVMRHLKACARISYDVDGLVRTAFKTLKPFPRRQDIVSKQTCYLNALKEKYRWRDMQRAALSERENSLNGLEGDAHTSSDFECCAVNRPGEVWVAYGEPPLTRICFVDCSQQTMTDTGIMLDERVTSMETAGQEIVLVGTMSWYIHAFSQSKREQAWEQRVHDAILSMQVYLEDDGTGNGFDNTLTSQRGERSCNSTSHINYRLFAGLADGTVAVLENISLSCSNYDLFYLPIGQSPVTCIKLLDNQLWCACGNTVSIIHASTLDPVDRFNVSANPYDAVLSLMPGLPGVWISVKGSSILELWDPATLSCKLLYDIRNGRYPNLRKEDDSYFNAARITSVLALDHSVWVGTGEGTLITFDVFAQAHKTPSDCSDYLNDAANFPIPSRGDDGSEWSFVPSRQDSESYTTLLEVEKKVRDLYAQTVSAESTETDGDNYKNSNINANSASDYYSNSSGICIDSAENVSTRTCYVVAGGGDVPTISNDKNACRKNVRPTSINVVCGEGSNRSTKAFGASIAGGGSSSNHLSNLNKRKNSDAEHDCKQNENSGKSETFCPPVKCSSQWPTSNGAFDDYRRTSIASGNTDASASSISTASVPYDSGFVQTTSCRSSESSGLATESISSFNTVSKQDTQANSEKPRPSLSSGQDGSLPAYNENTGNVEPYSNQSKLKKKAKSKKKASSASDTTSPPPHPDVYYLFRPDLPVEEKVKTDKTDKTGHHCDGFDENKNRRCFCGTVGLDPLAPDGISINGKGSKKEFLNIKDDNTVKEKSVLDQHKHIEGCSNASFDIQFAKESIDVEKAQSTFSVPNGVQNNHTSNGTCDLAVESGLEDENFEHLTHTSHHNNGRSASLDSTKTVGSDDVFHNNIDMINTLNGSESEKCSQDIEAKVNKKESIIDVIDVENVPNVTTITDELEGGKNSGEKNKNEIDNKLEATTACDVDQTLVINGNHNVVKESDEHELGENDQNDTSAIAVDSDSDKDDAKSPVFKVDITVKESLDRVSKDQKASSFSTVKALASRFEAAQMRVSPSRPILSSREKPQIKRTVSLGSSGSSSQSRLPSEHKMHHTLESVPCKSDNDSDMTSIEAMSHTQIINVCLNDPQNTESHTQGKVIEHENLSASATLKDAESNTKTDSKNKLDEDKITCNVVRAEQSLNPADHVKNTSTEAITTGKEIINHIHKKGSEKGQIRAGVSTKSCEKDGNNSKLIESMNKRQNNSKKQSQTVTNMGSNSIHIPNDNKTAPSKTKVMNHINKNNNNNNIKSKNLTSVKPEASTKVSLPQAKLTNPSVVAAQIDTTFYGDSDEDARVHEARVQSFKDSYKRLSANCLKIKSPDSECSSAWSTIECSEQSSKALSSSKESKISSRKDRSSKSPIKNGTLPTENGGSLSVRLTKKKKDETSSDSQTSPAASPRSTSTHFKPFIDRKSPKPAGTAVNTSNTPSSVAPNTSTSKSVARPLRKTKSTISSSTLPRNNTSTVPPATVGTTSSTCIMPSSSSTSSIATNSSDANRRGSDLSSIHDNFRSRDAGARWRLDYTNVHVDTTDLESLAMSSVSRDRREDREDAEEDSRRKLSCISSSSDIKNIRLSQFLKDTSETFTAQFGYAHEEEMKLVSSPSTSLKLSNFLSTPTMSGCGSLSWSSYDEISTPPGNTEEATEAKEKGEVKCFPRPSAYSHGCSGSTSRASTMELCYSTDLSLLSKNKISIKSVKGLVSTHLKGKPLVLSFAGSQSDDEAVLIWTREANETLWTNCPVFEYNPATKTSTLPSYMRTPLSRSNSSSISVSPRSRVLSN